MCQAAGDQSDHLSSSASKQPGFLQGFQRSCAPILGFLGRKGPHASRPDVKAHSGDGGSGGKGNSSGGGGGGGGGGDGQGGNSDDENNKGEDKILSLKEVRRGN